MFSMRLTLLRKASTLTQEDLAFKINVSRQAVASWEIGRSEPSLDILLKLSDFFMVSTDYLLGKTNIRDSYITDKKLCEYINECTNLYHKFIDEVDQDK